MTPAHDFPIPDIVGQVAIGGVYATRRQEAISSDQVLKRTNHVPVTAKILIVPSDDPKLIAWADRPCAVTVYMPVIRIHSVFSPLGRDECARWGGDPAAHPARLTMGTRCKDSQCGSSGGSPVDRAGHINSQFCRGLFPLTITGQRQQDHAARQARHPVTGDIIVLTSTITGATADARDGAGQRPCTRHRQPIQRAVRGKAYEQRQTYLDFTPRQAYHSHVAAKNRHRDWRPVYELEALEPCLTSTVFSFPH